MPRTAVIGLALALGLGAGAAHAGPAGDELGKCLLKATTDADRTALVVWLFEEISVHPAVKSLTTITDAQRTEARKAAAVLIERLLTQDCRPQTAEALRSEGPASLQTSFQAVGQAAVGSLTRDPAVAANVQQIAQYLDVSKFVALMNDPGAGAKK